MSWIQSAGANPDLPGVLQLRPSLAKRYTDFLAGFEVAGTVPTEVLEACQNHVRRIHGIVLTQHADREAGDTLDPDPDGELDGEVDGEIDGGLASALIVAEKMPYGHHTISDEEVRQLATYFGNAGAVNLLTAIAMYDAQARLECAFGVAPLPSDRNIPGER